MKGIAFTVTGGEPFDKRVNELRKTTADIYRRFFKNSSYRFIKSLAYTLVVPEQYSCSKRFRRRRRGEWRRIKKLYNKIAKTRDCYDCRFLSYDVAGGCPEKPFCCNPNVDFHDDIFVCFQEHECDYFES